MSELSYYLGCPIWSKAEWAGNLFAKNAKPGDYLRQYTAVFNTVEGNTTFRFCFKFPQTISHHLRLQHAEKEASAFLNLMSPLGERLGPFFVQLPSSFGAQEFATLEKFLKILPTEFRYTVEVRHMDFFKNGEAEKKLNALLEELQMGRVVFDTRGLHAVKAESKDAITREAQRKKPKVPARFLALSGLPFVRFVGDPVITKNEALLVEWAERVVAWLAEGMRPYIFMHAPNDVEAPQLARYFHNLLHKLAPEMSALPQWTGEKRASNMQMGLFG